MILECMEKNLDRVIDDLGKGNISKLLIVPSKQNTEYPELQYIMDIMYYKDLQWHSSLKLKMNKRIEENGLIIINVINAVETFKNKLLHGKVENFSLTFDITKLKDKPIFNISYKYIEPRNTKNVPRLVLKNTEIVPEIPKEEKTLKQLLDDVKLKLGDEKLQTTTQIFKKYGSGRSKKQKRLTVENLLNELFEYIN